MIGTWADKRESRRSQLDGQTQKSQSSPPTRGYFRCTLTVTDDKDTLVDGNDDDWLGGG